ncbi:hypothetical protein SMSP2_01554 [Limihaloglobus sulfuriphilus]|uniref:Uncharacterized protein n=1 Tax=Limihaloglobus sulfuriphilus TaxID=1851148 RepID=A0A1Q2MF63_9BACT|nr:hypothetical protein [Limihaloglobus sulfuriphilus]AQQ71188.1 hypothetical protein SMSP2_01554 [Limihaloglobus sulfuriphilus]
MKKKIKKDEWMSFASWLREYYPRTLYSKFRLKYMGELGCLTHEQTARAVYYTYPSAYKDYLFYKKYGALKATAVPDSQSIFD